MDQNKNYYLIGKALRYFLFASVLTMAIGQLATTIDGIIVSHLVSPDALSAITLFLPINLVITAFTTLLGSGACIIATKAIGRRDKEAVSGILSTALTSILIAGVCFLVVGFGFGDKVAALLTQDAHMYPFLVPYLSVMMGCAVAIMLNNFFNQCVEIDGFPKKVTIAVTIIGVTNILLDLIFVSLWGILGSAIATILAYLFGTAFLFSHLFSKHSDIHFRIKWSGFRKYLGPNLLQGLPMLIGNLVLIFLFYAMNNIVQAKLGHNGMFVMSVCMNIFLVGLMLANGFGGTITSLGGFLYGQRDFAGVRYLVKKCLFAIMIIAISFSLFVEVVPGAISSLFGANTPELEQMVNAGLRAFIVCLAPFCLIIALANNFQMIGKVALSPIVILMIPVSLLSLMMLFAHLDPSPDATVRTPLLWYAFPVSGCLAFLCTFCIAEIIRLKERPNPLTHLTLLPLRDGAHLYELSIPNDRESFVQVIAHLKEILMQFCKEEQQINQICNSVEEVLLNTIEHSGIMGNGHYSDVRFVENDGQFTVAVKYEGRAFNPLNTTLQERKIGLSIVFGLAEEVDYKFMYGQNMVYLSWNKINKQ